MGNHENFRQPSEAAWFREQITYYMEDYDPTSSQIVKTYAYKTIFIHERNFHFHNKNQMRESLNYFFMLTRAPASLQTIYHIHANTDIRCSTNYTIAVFADHFNFTLKGHLDLHRAKNTELTYREIFYILRQLAALGTFLEKRSLMIESLDPNKIYLDSGYCVKIGLQSIKKEGNSDNAQLSLLSPEEIATPSLNPSNSNRVFSLGMLILECLTLLDGAVTYYDYFHKKINLQKLHRDLQAVPHTTLRPILCRMMEVDPSKRATFKQISQTLSKLGSQQFQSCLLID